MWLPTRYFDLRLCPSLSITLMFSPYYIDSYHNIVYVLGFGVFALKDLSKGSPLLIYKGDLILSEVADERSLVYEKQDLGCYLFYFMHHGRKMWYS